MHATCRHTMSWNIRLLPVLITLITPVFSSMIKSNEGWFWHVTDFHLDNTYGDKQLSCQVKVSEPGIYGDHWCDSPWLLCQDAVQAMKDIKQDVDFIIWTGDSVPHGDDEDMSTDSNVEIIAQLTELLIKAFPGVPIYPTLGNCDYWPASQFPAKPSSLYKKVLQYWKHWIHDSEQQKTFEKGGYYTLKSPYGLRIIALNTNLYNVEDHQTSQTSDPDDQLTWLNEILEEAEEHSEKVMIIGHIPPGVHTSRGNLWMHENQAEQLNEVILKHAHVIFGMHFGHEHADHFRMYYNSNDEPLIPVFIAPSVTPRHPSRSGHNPGVRLISYDRNTDIHLEMIQYYMDLQDDNKNGKSNWKKEYTMTQDYGIPDLSAESMNKLIGQIKDKDGSDFEKYDKWQLVSVPKDTTMSCDHSCKREIFCSFKISSLKEYEKCVKQG